MALEVSNISDFQQYFEGVMDRADDHADNVNEIILALVGGVVWKSNGRFQVKQYAGMPANMLWMEVGGKRYCFKFNHNTGCIEVHRNTHNGDIIMEFNNATPLSAVKSFFEKL